VVLKMVVADLLHTPPALQKRMIELRIEGYAGSRGRGRLTRWEPARAGGAARSRDWPHRGRWGHRAASDVRVSASQGNTRKLWRSTGVILALDFQGLFFAHSGPPIRPGPGYSEWASQSSVLQELQR
jgi:hypothetical protein